MSTPSLRLGICAGETSGDILAGSVLKAWRHAGTTIELSGIGGPETTALGLRSLAPMERLAVMGLVEPLKRLPQLLKIRRQLIAQQLDLRPQLFLGVDSPDFNLPIERRLKASGVPTAHLVSPSVWAWRRGRIRSIRASVDKMLCLLPFEVDIYRQAGIDAVCVGHPLVDELTKLASVSETRQQLELPSGCTILGILPGSRESEVRYLMPHFVEAMSELHRRHPELHFVVPAANENRRAEIDALLGCHDLPVTVTLGRGREAMRASDALLIASGTAALEAMLLRKPMVISYRMAAASWAVLSRMVKTPHVGLPNILAGQAVAPELLQTEATAGRMVHEVSDLLESGGAQQVACFNELAERIGGNFAARSIDALAPLVG